jgi:sulfite reductase (ferredoxin)
MLFGGSAGEQGELGKAVMRVPAKRVIEAILKIIEVYRAERAGGETLHQWVTKIVKGQGAGSVKGLEDIKNILAPVVQLPPAEQDPDAYRDYGSDSKFVAKTARGECAA